MFDIASLRIASFDGLPFWVTTHEPEPSHRVNTTTVPNGKHINETFGPGARKYEIDGYCIGANLATIQTLVARVESRPLGTLVLPDFPPDRVYLLKVRPKFDKEKLGYIGFTLEAVSEPSQAGPGGLSANILENSLYAAALDAVVPFGAFAGATFSVAATVLDLADVAFSTGAAVTGDLMALRELARLDPDQFELTRQPFEAAVAALSGIARAPAAFGEAIATAAIALGDAADPAALAESIASLGPVTPAAAASVSSGTAIRAAQLAEAGVALTAAARALTLGEATARRVYIDRNEAFAARALAVAVFNDALSKLGRDGIALATVLRALSGLSAEIVTRRSTDIAPIITVAAPLRLPSLWWSHRLYGTHARADEVAARSGVLNPGYLPTRFEALAA